MQPLLPTPTDPRSQLTAQVKMLAARNGLTVSAVTSTEPFQGLAEFMERHIRAGHVEGMDWFTIDRARFSSDVRNLHPTAKSVISVGLAYWSGVAEKPDDGVIRGKISRYAWGRDYHRILKRRLKALQVELEDHLGESLDTRILVDTARIVERAVAARAGLGWYGKHSNIIVPGHGSWVMLGEMLTELELLPDTPLEKNCGRCTICIDNCPTGAIQDAYTIHAPSCISFLTIEERRSIPHELRPQMQDWVYGCDVCQDVCPYTAAAKPVDEPEMMPASINNQFPSLHWLLQMTEAEFGENYFGTPVPRTKRRGLARNAAIALGNIGTEEDVPVLVDTLCTHDETLVREHAAWALGRLGATDELRRAARGNQTPEVHAEIDLAVSSTARSS